MAIGKIIFINTVKVILGLFIGFLLIVVIIQTAQSFHELIKHKRLTEYHEPDDGEVTTKILLWGPDSKEIIGTFLRHFFGLVLLGSGFIFIVVSFF